MVPPLSFSRKEILEAFVGDKLAGLHGLNVAVTQICLSLFMGRIFLAGKQDNPLKPRERCTIYFPSVPHTTLP